MIAIILRTIRDRWKMLVAVTLIGMLTMLMYTSLFPSYQKILSQNQQLYSQMPEALRKAFNIDSFSFDTLEKFLNIEMYSLFWPVLMIILTLSLSGSSLAGEVERETIAQSLAQPVSRSRVYLAKFLAATKIFTVFNVLVNASVFPIAAAFKVSLIAGHFLCVAIMCELFGLALLGMGFAVSSFMSDKGKVTMTMGGLVLVMYVLNIVSSILTSLDKLKYASLFHYFNPNVSLIEGRYDTTSMSVFIALFIFGALIGWWRWTRRDIV